MYCDKICNIFSLAVKSLSCLVSSNHDWILESKISTKNNILELAFATSYFIHSMSEFLVEFRGWGQALPLLETR